MTSSDFIESIYKKVGESDYNQDVAGWLSTGFLPLDYAISGKYQGGGLPMGRISEIFGPESSGKTLLATMAMIQTQRLGGLAVFLDFEHAFAIRRAVQLGLGTDKNLWLYKQPDTAEEGFQIVDYIGEMVVKNGIEKPVTIVKDSVASMITQSEMDTGIGDENMKTRLSLASCMSTNLKKLAKIVNKTNITLIFLNQTRENPGVMFGEKTTTPGGNALRFYASMRAKLRKTGKVKDEDTGAIIGEKVSVQIVKNKVFEPFREADYISVFKEGINLHRSHLDSLAARGLLGSTKGYLEFEGKKWRAGALEKMLREDNDAYQRLLGLFNDAPEPVKFAVDEE
jgi:protein RecA